MEQIRKLTCHFQAQESEYPQETSRFKSSHVISTRQQSELQSLNQDTSECIASQIIEFWGPKDIRTPPKADYGLNPHHRSVLEPFQSPPNRSEEHPHKLKQFLDDMSTPVSRMESRVDALCERFDSSEREAERLRILGWVSSILYEEDHYFASEGRTTGTGEWLLQDERYRKWRTSNASEILWLHGDREHHCIPIPGRDFLTRSDSGCWQNEARFYCHRRSLKKV